MPFSSSLPCLSLLCCRPPLSSAPPERHVQWSLLPLGLLHSGRTGAGRGQPAGGRWEGTPLPFLTDTVNVLCRVRSELGCEACNGSPGGGSVSQPVSKSGAIASVVTEMGGECCELTGETTSRPSAARIVQFSRSSLVEPEDAQRRTESGTEGVSLWLVSPNERHQAGVTGLNWAVVIPIGGFWPPAGTCDPFTEASGHPRRK